MRSRVCRSDHATERVADDVGLVDAEFFTKRFEIIHQIVEGIRRCGNGRLAVSPQIIADAFEALGKVMDQPLPYSPARTNAMDHEEGRSGSVDRIGAIHRCHNRPFLVIGELVADEIFALRCALSLYRARGHYTASIARAEQVRSAKYGMTSSAKH